MTTKADQPAFPINEEQLDAKGYLVQKCNPGMTLRQYFAGRNMQGLLASWGQHDVTDFSELASDAVKAADALIAELEKE